MKPKNQTATDQAFRATNALWCLSALLLAGLAKPVTAQEVNAPTPAAKAALEVLTQGSSQADAKQTPKIAAEAPSPMTTTSPIMPGGQNASFVVQAGQTLDRIIRDRLPQAPFKNDLIRRAFMDLNPRAFPLGTPHLIPAGAVISVPTPEQIRQSALAQNPRLSAYLGGQDGDDPAPRKAKEDRRRWVRYP